MLSASILPALKFAALGLVVLFFAIGGVFHFATTDAFVGIVPPWVPFPREVVYLTGVLELLGAAGVCLPRWRLPGQLVLLGLIWWSTQGAVFRYNAHRNDTSL